jgi:hypothetical protein
MDVLLGLGVQGMAGASQDKQVPLSSPRPIWLLALNPILRLIWELPLCPSRYGSEISGPHSLSSVSSSLPFLSSLFIPTEKLSVCQAILDSWIMLE